VNSLRRERGAILRSRRLLNGGGWPLKLFSKDFPVVSTVGWLWFVSLQGFVEREGQTA
jgi:hypothetical protein